LKKTTQKQERKTQKQERKNAKLMSSSRKCPYMGVEDILSGGYEKSSKLPCPGGKIALSGGNLGCPGGKIRCPGAKSHFVRG